MPATFIAHCDESGDDGRIEGKSSPYFIDGGFVVKEDARSSLEERIAALIVQRYPGHDDNDLKRALRNSLAATSGRGRSRAIRYITRLFGILADHEAIAVAMVLAKSTEIPVRDNEKLRRTAIQGVLGRLQSYASRNDGTFSVVHDNVAYQAPDGVHSRNDEITRFAARWQASQQFCRFTGVTFDTSKTPLLQAADHVIGPVIFTVCSAHVDWAWSPRGKTVLPEVRLELHEELEQLIDRQSHRASIEIRDLRTNDVPRPLPPPS